MYRESQQNNADILQILEFWKIKYYGTKQPQNLGGNRLDVNKQWIGVLLIVSCHHCT